jgi:hypothetical protein
MAIAMRLGTPLPEPLALGLRQVAGRWRHLVAMRRLGRLVLALTLAAAVGIALDVVIPLPLWIRWAMWLGWVGLAAGGLLFGVVGVLRRRLGWVDVAAVAETGHPELSERLTSTVGLLDPATQPHGSAALIAALAADTASRVTSVDLTTGLSPAMARRWLAAGAIAASAFVLTPIVRPDPFAGLARRFFLPWTETERVGRFVIDVRPGDAVAARGDDLDVRVEVRPRFAWAGAVPDSAALEWIGENGQSHRLALQAEEAAAPASGRRFLGTLRALEASLEYRVVSGPDQSRSHRVKVVDPPAVERIEVRVEPPAYTRFPTVEARDPSRISAWEDSVITLTVTPNRPMTRVAVAWPASSAEPAGSEAGAPGATAEEVVILKPVGDGASWTCTVEAGRSGTYRLMLEDEYHLSNRPEPPRRVIVVPDLPPDLALSGSEDTQDVRADDVIVVETAARDDVAVAGVSLRYVIDRSAHGTRETEGASRPDQGEVPAPLAGLGTALATGQAALPLKTLGLRSGDVVAYAIEALDNRPAPKGPNRTRSRPRRLIVRDQAESLAARQGRAERESLRARLAALKLSVTAHHQATVQLRYAADAVLRGNGKWEAAQTDGLAQRAREADQHIQTLDELARDLADAGRFAVLAKPTQQLAEVEAAGAREMIGRAATEKEPARRLADLRLADSRVGAVETRLDELIRKFDELAKEEDDRRRLQLLAENQEDLAARAEDLADSRRDPAALEALRHEQDALRQQVDEIARRSPDLKAELLRRQAEEADELARAARELAARQRAQERQTAESPARQALLREIAREQEALVHDARRLALDVDAPLQDNSRGKINLDPLTQPIDPLLRGDLEPARQRIEQAQAELTRLNRDLDDVRGDPKTVARRLAKRQDEVAQRLNTALQANTPQQRAEQPGVLKGLVDRQDAISQLAQSLAAPEPQKPLLDQAKAATAKALEAVRGPADPAQVVRANEARDALNRLADALPEPWQRRQQAQQQVNEARGKLDEVAREVERHLRETGPGAQPPPNPINAARDLAKRVEPLAQRAAEAARGLEALDTLGEADPQRDRAAHRAEALASLLKEVQQAAPPDSEANRPAEPAADWHVLGPFDRNTAPPFGVAGPIDFKATTPGRDKKPLTWRPVASGPGGKVDLQALLSKTGPTENSVAFGVTEVPGGAGGPGQLSIGSDDSITVWLNGKQVFEYGGARGWMADSNKADVVFQEGPNRIVIACGNGSGEWAFSVASVPPPTGEQAARLARVAQLRRRLELQPADARASIDRLQQALEGRTPADERAREIADTLHALQQAEAPVDLEREELERASAALRAMNVPDAPTFRAQAVRQAEQAANALAQAQAHDPSEPRGGQAREPQGRPSPAEQAKALEAAADAAQDLAERLADALPAAAQAAALARAQDALGHAAPAARDPAAQARDQHGIAADLARVPDRPGAPAAEARDRAEHDVAQAASLADRASQGNAQAAVGPRQVAEARQNAAQALSALAQALQAGRPGEASAREPGGDHPATNAPAPGQEPGGAPRPAEATADRGQPDRPHPAPPAAAGHTPAERAGRPLPADPELGLTDAHRSAAQELARRERRIAEQLQSVLGAEIRPQEALRGEAAALARTMDALRQQVGEQALSGAAQGPAQAASNMLQHQAAGAMNQSIEHLAQGRLPAARDTQRQAADHLENAARHASDLASALRNDVPADAQAQHGASGRPSPDGQAHGSGQHNPGPLAQARDAQNEAARELAQAQAAAQGQHAANHAAATHAASEAMHQAAQGLRAASSSAQAGERLAQSLAEHAQQSNPAFASGATPQSAPGQEVDPHLGALDPAQLARSGRRWGELPGHLRNEILQMTQGRYRDDYARLIQLYFREIGGAPAETAPGSQP